MHFDAFSTSATPTPESFLGEAVYAEACAAGGYAVNLEDLAKAPPHSNGGFVVATIETSARRDGYVITLVKNRAPNVTDIGSPSKTCNASKNQPASGYFAEPDQLAGSVHLEVVTDDHLSFPSLADFIQILLVRKAGLCSRAVIQNQKSGLRLPRNFGQL